MSCLASRRVDIEWVASTAASMRFDGEFELAVMTGHAFQVLIADDEVRQSLAAIRRALVDGGRFAFETRNPLARAWESWTPEYATDVVDPAGRHVRGWHEVERVVGDVVTVTETTARPDGTPLRVDRASLRFLDAVRFRSEWISLSGCTTSSPSSGSMSSPRWRRCCRYPMPAVSITGR